MLSAGTLLVAVPVSLVALETAAALLWRLFHRRHDLNGPPAPSLRPPLAVLIPAHNEEQTLARALGSILPQLSPDDRLVVVADNCTDRTAAIARSTDAEVVERNNESQRGKGYALAAGVEYLTTSAAVPPAVVVIMDADMHVASGTIDRLAREALRRDAAVQAIYMLEAPAKSSTQVRVSALAFTFKNQVRALGAHLLGMPCLLRGTGMAFPWPQIAQAPLATGNLVEDLQLGIDLAVRNTAPRLVANARVTGKLPARTAAAAVQRRRWEHGHMQTILRSVPRLMVEGLKQRRLDLIALAFDVAVPPLALLVLAWCSLMLVAGVMWINGLVAFGVFAACAGVGMLLAVSVLAGWAVFGRQVLPLTSLVSVPLYILWKVPLYLAFLFRRQREWVRTERASE